jgi:hypothetical protein
MEDGEAAPARRSANKLAPTPKKGRCCSYLSSILCRARPAAGAPKKRAQPLRAAPVKIQSGVILLGGCDLAFGFPIA